MNVAKTSVRRIDRILHISNTDIARDSRILKELKVASELSDVLVFACGAPKDAIAGSDCIAGVSYYEQVLLTRKLTIFPRALRYFFEIFEFTIRTVSCAKSIRPTVVHCHDTFALPSGWIAKRFFGARLIYDAHELESNKNGQNIVLSKCTLWIEKLIWEKVDLFISVSGAIIDWYMRELGKKPNVLILNSPEISNDSAKTVELFDTERYFNRKFNIPSDSVVFVYLGILGSGRGIDTIVSAFADTDDPTHVVFVGFGPMARMIQDYSNDFGNIHLHDPVPHNQVVSLVKSADFGLCLIENVSLSDYYCLPNKLFEYAFAGLPVLASKFPEIERVVSAYSLGECCELDCESVQNAIARLVARGPIRIDGPLTELSWATQASRLTLAYEELLERRIGPSRLAGSN